jgi:hypothetical protein
MRTTSFGLVTCLAALIAIASPAGAQEVFLQNDSFGGGAVSCYTGIGVDESVSARLTAAPGQYPYTINRVRVFGCGGGLDAFNVFIFQDNGSGVAPGPLIWQSANSYGLSGGSVFNDILMSSEPIPPPPITSGTVRVELYDVLGVIPIGFGADLGGIMPQRNFLRTFGVWSYAETQGVTGDWILRLGINPPSSQPALSILDVVVPEGSTGTSQAIFTVTLSPPNLLQQVTVHYATSDGTATAGSDYVATSGDLTFAIGQTVATFPVTINGDGTDEPNETLTVDLSNPVNAIIDRGTGTGTITDDDLPGFRFHTVPPCRVVDTRTGSPLGAGTDRTLTVAGLCLVPSTAKAVAVNLTVTQPTTAGHVTVFPAGGTLPTTSSINYSVGQTKANNGIFGLGTAGALVAHCGQVSGTTHFILDVYGYFE